MPQNELIMRLEKNIEELGAINSIIQEITLNVSKPDFMDFVYDTIYSIIAPDLSLIYLIEEGGLRLQGDPLRGSSFKSEVNPHHKIGECLCGIVAETGEAIYSEDLLTYPPATKKSKIPLSLYTYVPIVISQNPYLKSATNLNKVSQKTYEQLTETSCNFRQLLCQPQYAANPSGLSRNLCWSCSLRRGSRCGRIDSSAAAGTN